MTKTKYMHYAITEYLSVSMTCVFAMENYMQATSVDANCELRKQFNECMSAYENIYAGRKNWTPSTEDLVDYKMISHFQFLAENAADIFLNKFESLIQSIGCDDFDIRKTWKSLRQTQPINDAILNIVKDLRKWEEDNI